MTTLGALIVSFFRNYLANQKGYAVNTIASYSDCIRLLLAYVCGRLNVSFDKLSLEMISDELILDFLDDLEKNRGNAPTTRNQRLGAIKTFFRFLALQEPMATAVCERVCAISPKKTEHKVIATLDNKEVKAVLGCAQASTDTILGAGPGPDDALQHRRASPGTGRLGYSGRACGGACSGLSHGEGTKTTDRAPVPGDHRGPPALPKAEESSGDRAGGPLRERSG